MWYVECGVQCGMLNVVLQCGTWYVECGMLNVVCNVVS